MSHFPSFLRHLAASPYPFRQTIPSVILSLYIIYYKYFIFIKNWLPRRSTDDSRDLKDPKDLPLIQCKLRAIATAPTPPQWRSRGKASFAAGLAPGPGRSQYGQCLTRPFLHVRSGSRSALPRRQCRDQFQHVLVGLFCCWGAPRLSEHITASQHP